MSKKEEESLRKIGYTDLQINLEKKQRIEEKALLISAILNLMLIIVILFIVLFWYS